MSTREHILLTGAGFTKNFGAPLAAELWSIILGSPYLAEYPDLQNILRNNFDFESVFHQVITGSYGNDEKKAMNDAVYEAYHYIDRLMKQLSSTGICLNGLREMIGRFAGSAGQPGFVFTLNQDLFLERYYRNQSGPPICIPGIERGQRWFSEEFRGPMDSGDQVQLPASSPPIDHLLKQAGFYYVKLHGSMNWYDPRGEFRLVIGQGKESIINAEPILKSYLEIFREALCSGKRRLLCIGYSFRDRHINEVLVESIKHGLQLFVLSPGAPDTLQKQLKEQGCAELWSALAEYFPFDLRTLFPENQTGAYTPQCAHVLRRFFNDRSGDALRS